MGDIATLRSKLEAFVEIRNRSSHNTNLQFQLDLETAGLSRADIGDPHPGPDGRGFRWHVIDDGGEYLGLLEKDGVLSVQDTFPPEGIEVRGVLTEYFGYRA